MTISLSRNALVSVIGGADAEASERISFLGAVHRVEDVRGGELFVDAGDGGEALAAFERGAAICVARSSGVHAGFPEPARLLLVDDPIDAYVRLAGWWRVRIGCPVLALSASHAAGSMRGMVARLLLGSGQGAYSLSREDARVAAAGALCSLSRAHGWAVIALPEASDPHFESICRLVSPDVAVLSSEAELAALEKAAPDRLSAIIAEEGALPAASSRVSTYGRGAACEARLSDVKVGIRGTSFTLSLAEESAEIRIRQLGAREALAAAGSALAARRLTGELPLERARAALGEYVDATSPISYVELDDDARIVFDARPPAGGAAMTDLTGLCRELRESGFKVGVILSYAGLEEPPAGSESAIGAVMEAEPGFLVVWQGKWTGRPASKGVIHARDMADLAAHSQALDFDALLIRGALQSEVVGSIVTNWQSLRANPVDMQ